MTHDELLAKMQLKRWSFVEYDDYLNYRRALRAVVELHKPLKFSDEQTMCVGCSLKKFAHPYPCPTIQAIEKELK